MPDTTQLTRETISAADETKLLHYARLLGLYESAKEYEDWMPHADIEALRARCLDKVGRPTGAALLDHLRGRDFGFLSLDDVAELASNPETRMTPILVRCGSGRFLCPAQDAKLRIEQVENHDTDYVRDVALPAREGRR